MRQAGSEGTMDEERGIARIVRDFDFPRESVFKMFTDPKKAAKWFGTPEGAVVVFFELDARPGGAITIHDQEPGGPIHKTSGTILEIVEPERIQFKSATALLEGETPFEALQTVTLEELGPRKTRVTVVVQVLFVASVPGGVDALVEGFTLGWGQTFDKLQRELH